MFISHGREDPAVEYSLAECSRERLTEAGFDVVFHSFSGGHSLADAETDGIFERVAAWLKEYENHQE